MKILKLIIKNSLRHKLRTSLTIIGIAIAVIAFGILRTVVTAWNAGVEATSANRLVTRQAVSFIFPLPLAYQSKIESIPGVTEVAFANWFGGVYIDKNNFFARYAVSDNFLDIYPEYIVPKNELEEYNKERNACILGSDLAKRYNLKVGDAMTLEGDIFPGRWDFVIRGIYKPRYKSTDASQMIFHWDYVNERMKKESPGRANEVGWYVEQIKDPSQSGEISDKIDALFKNSTAETKTESERAFQQGFIASSSAIITSMNVISFVIIGIIMLVLGNTMIMSARERTREYAVMKTLGFSAKHLVGLIMGESLFISAVGAAIGLLLTFPLIVGFSQVLPKGYFPVFQLEPITVIIACSAAILVGIVSAVFPIQKSLKTNIVDGFRFVG